MSEGVGGAVGLEQATAAYEENPTPEAVTELWKEFWSGAGAEVGIELTVERFPGTPKGLSEHLRAGDMPIYVPVEVAGQEDRYLLGQMWPEMRSYSVERGNLVSNEEPRSGWRYIEASLEAPHRRTTKQELSKALADLRREGMNLTEYVIGAQMRRKLTGHYFDESTWSRLLGSREGGGVVRAGFGASGYLRVVPDWGSQGRHGGLGGRSSEGV
jgi:hypothetical protein